LGHRSEKELKIKKRRPTEGRVRKDRRAESAKREHKNNGKTWKIFYLGRRGGADRPSHCYKFANFSFSSF
jgi:hypothetical protein